MIEILAPALAAASAAGFTALAMRGERRRLEDALAAEQSRVERLTTLLMSREAPAEYAAYVEPTSLAEPFPENAIWDDSGLYYVVPGEL